MLHFVYGMNELPIELSHGSLLTFWRFTNRIIIIIINILKYVSGQKF